MHPIYKHGLSLAVSVVLIGAALAAEPERQPGAESRPATHQGESRPAPRSNQGEPHPGPSGYQRVTEPSGWNKRPASVDRPTYQHNYQAARSFKIGVYRRPPGWTTHRWGYGEILPRAYWTPSYLLADYWLFALEVPPAGYEWVRDNTDALLVNIQTGEILQVEYGVFA